VPYSDIRVDYMDTHERRVLDLRPDGLTDVPLLGWYSYSHARPDLPIHCHRGPLEICYLERGSQFFQVEDREYRLSGGEVLVTLPDLPHSTAGQPSQPCILYWLNLRLPKRGRSLLSLPSKDSGALILAIQNLSRWHFPGSVPLKALFDRLLDIHDDPQTALRTIRLRQAVVQLLLEVIDCARRHAESDRVQRMAKVLNTIEGRANEDFRLQDLARQAGLSLSRFKVRFKEETGVSPRQFIVRTKIDVARRRLRTGQEPIGKIALDLGFPTSQYFATVFRRFMGVSPKEYRLEAARPHGPSRRHEDRQR
jgi:AraC-like DNA-binding protein